MWKPLSIVAALAAAQPALGQLQDAAYTSVARYSVHGARVALAAGVEDIQLGVTADGRQVTLRLDAATTREWADTTERTLNLRGGEPAGDSLDFDSRVLRHPVLEQQGGVLLTRSFLHTPSSCYLTVWLGEGESITLRLTDAEARELLAGLRRASASAEHAAELTMHQLDTKIQAVQTTLQSINASSATPER